MSARPTAVSEAEPTASAVLKELRRTRRLRRTADLEWFEVMYKVYLVVISLGSLVWWLSGFIDDAPVSAAGLSDLRSAAPAAGGLLAALALLLGLRSGAHGGPIALEEAEVRHVLAAPVRPADVLRPPTIQRVRSLLGIGVLSGAIVGELASRRLPGTTLGWMVSVAATGTLVAAAYLLGAIGAHGLGWGESRSTLVGTVVVGLQVAALAGALPAAPLDTIGSLALWPLRIRLVDLLAVVILVALWFAVSRLAERFSAEMMLRRSSLVAQLRFAVTMQDLRTVMLLRRQLSLEQTRRRPWLSIGRRGPAIWRRSLRSLDRFPARRLGRMVALSVGGGAAAVFAFRGTSPLFVVCGLAVFLLGLEAMEPLAQEVDHPDLTDTYPHEAGRIHQRLLAAPSALLLVAAIPGMLTAVVFEPSVTTLAVAALIGFPAALLGGGAAALNTLDGAPDPSASGKEGAMLPPEMAGVHMLFRLVRPPLIACLGTVPIILVKAAVERGEDPIAMAARTAAGVLVATILVVWWVERRVAFHTWWEAMMAEGKTQRSSGI